MVIKVQRERVSGRRVAEHRKNPSETDKIRPQTDKIHEKTDSFSSETDSLQGERTGIYQASPKTARGAGSDDFRFSSIFRASASEIGSVLSGG